MGPKERLPRGGYRQASAARSLPRRALRVLRMRRGSLALDGTATAARLYFASLSGRTLVYKGMVRSEVLAGLALPQKRIAPVLGHPTVKPDPYAAIERRHPEIRWQWWLGRSKVRNPVAAIPLRIGDRHLPLPVHLQ